MQVYYDIRDVSEIKDAIVTAGTYDGVHKGHQKILERLLEIKKKSGGQTVVITYWPHPRRIVDKDKNPPKILYTLEERIDILKQFQIDHLLIIAFTKEFSQLSPDEYVRKFLLEKIKTKKLIIGYDHRFGKNREGSFDYLVNKSAFYGFSVEEIPREDVDHIGISSSKIRKALLEGDVRTANLYLGMAFHLKGTVVKGNQLGRTIGFPTANILVKDEDKLIPKDGVYAVKVVVKGLNLDGMLNIGIRPTIDGKVRVIEVHIFDFDSDIYDEPVEVVFIERIRDEKKFDGLESLKEQLQRDKVTSRNILSAN